MTSLAELRAIEEQRLFAERAARVAEDEARTRAAVAAERAVRDAEAARIAEERAAALATEQARHAAELEARLRVEAAEAAERARHQAKLDEARLAQEMDVARDIARRTKPRWMIAVTAAAVLAAGGLTWFAIDRMQQTAEAERSAAAARREKEATKAKAAEMQRTLAALEERSRESMTRIDRAIADVETRQTAAALEESRRRLEAERNERIRSANEQAKLDAKLEHLDRVAPIKMTEECLQGAIGRNDCRDVKQPKRHRAK